MSDKLEAKALELVDQLSAKLATLATQYGPEVVDAGLAVARLDAAQKLIAGAACAVVTVVAGRFAARKGIPAFAQARVSECGWSDSKCLWFWFGSAAPLALATAASLAAASRLLSVWTWAGIFDPKLYIAARVLGLT